MKYKITLLLLLLAAAFCHAGIEVPKSRSPDGKFAVFIETDKDQKDYAMDTCPAMWILDLKSKQKLCSFNFRADPSSDEQPLRSKCTFLWSLDGESLAIQFSSRHYTHLTAFRLVNGTANSKSFVECALPKDVEIIKSLVPRYREFRSRWFQSPNRWEGKTTLVYTAGTHALIFPTKEDCNDIAFDAAYQFYVDLKHPQKPIIRKIVYAGEN